MKATQYISTRGGVAPLSFRQAVMMGLADDGGLLLPAEIPQVGDRLDAWRRLDYRGLASALMHLFVGDDIPATEFAALVNRSYERFSRAEVAPVVAVGDLYVLELFHGPTLAFKDVALQFLGNVFEHVLTASGERLNIVGATSGDTGSAAICGVRGRRNIEIFIMHPHGKVSPIQERQMTTVLDPNVHNIAVQGTFDDGQRVLKEIFNDLPFKRRYGLGAVNSVNWARVLAQVVYYFHAAFRVQDRTGCRRVQFSVPTGNFGDIFAGYVALRMGAPISRLILATNENDILARFFTSGVYATGEVVPTLSPSMDIQVASNFERYLFYRCGGDGGKVRALMAQFAGSGRLELSGEDPAFVAGRGTTDDALAVISRCHREHGYLLDPHSAVGVAVGERFRRPDEPTVCLATAHPAKFPEAIRRATGQDLARHPAIEGILSLPTRCAVLPPTRQAVQEFIVSTLGTRC
ncbi:MAG: Threonine synthase [Lentisphaerae bacterium ADurb.BinA184]|nr:MAG: Threonine synthase [Lentisphaerae bacterium ADurb.BinA184]